jgi:two-component system sensor histidine kinase ChiS
VLLAEHDAEEASRVRELLANDLTVIDAAGTMDVVRTALAERPDLVLLGVSDDDAEGVATCRALRSCSAMRDTPIIMVAPSGRPEHVVAAFEAGANDYIVRPFAPAQLRAKAHTWLLRTGSTQRRADTGRHLEAASG